MRDQPDSMKWILIVILFSCLAGMSAPCIAQRQQPTLQQTNAWVHNFVDQRGRMFNFDFGQGASQSYSVETSGCFWTVALTVYSDSKTWSDKQVINLTEMSPAVVLDPVLENNGTGVVGGYYGITVTSTDYSKHASVTISGSRAESVRLRKAVQHAITLCGGKQSF
jgi:hypothetical protein